MSSFAKATPVAVEEAWLAEFGLTDDVTIKTGLTTCKPGHIVTHASETYPDVDLCGAAEAPAGVALGKVYPADADDIDTAFAAADAIRILKISFPSFIEVYVIQLGTATILHDDIIVTAASGNVTKFAYTNATVQLDTLITAIGTSCMTITGNATYTKILRIRGRG